MEKKFDSDEHQTLMINTEMRMILYCEINKYNESERTPSLGSYVSRISVVQNDGYQ